MALGHWSLAVGIGAFLYILDLLQSAVWDFSHFLPGFFDFAKTAFRVLLRAHAGEWQTPAALE
jgi:hypothetical protein